MNADERRLDSSFPESRILNPESISPPTAYRLPATAGCPLPAARYARPTRRSAFTLVELLVVITIIGILAGLIGVVAFRAMNTTRNSRIKVEVDQLDLAMKHFKDTYGDYPPADLRNPGTNAPLRSFVAKAFPRYDLSRLATDLTNAGVDTTNFRPDQALIFWLNGFDADITQPFRKPEPFQDANGNGHWDSGETYTDFNSNGTYDGASRTPPSYEFVKTRLLNSKNEPKDYVDSNNNNIHDGAEPYDQQVYHPDTGKTVPYVYFDSRSYGTVSPFAPLLFDLGSQIGVAYPYIFDINNNSTRDPNEGWVNPDSFQIISAGQDGVFGSIASPPAPDTAPATTLKLFPTGVGYNKGAGADDDNVANFVTKGSTLEDSKP